MSFTGLERASEDVLLPGGVEGQIENEPNSLELKERKSENLSTGPSTGKDERPLVAILCTLVAELKRLEEAMNSEDASDAVVEMILSAQKTDVAIDIPGQVVQNVWIGGSDKKTCCAIL